MATKILPTPSVNAIVPFDPSMEYTISFVYLGEQIVKNRIVIIDNITSDEVYSEYQTTGKLQHTIPANTLIAGNQYIIQVKVFDSDGNESGFSSPVLFYCFSTPTFEFINTSTNEYKSADITLNLKYEQTEGETIKSFQFFKYGLDNTLLESSNVYYSTSELSHTFYGLDNNNTYYFRAICETNHGIILHTEIEVTVMLDMLPSSIEVDVNNHYKEGYVSLRLNLKLVEHELSNDNYELKDGLLVLKNNSLLYYGFELENNFSLFLEAKELPIKRFFTTNDDVFSLSIINVCGIYYCKLEVRDSTFAQHIPLPNASLTSDGYIEVVDKTIGDNVLVGIIVRRISGYYGLEIYYKPKE